MLTKEPTAEMAAEWKKVYEENRHSITPNRKTGEEVNRYFTEKYSFSEFESPEFADAVRFNITENEHNFSKLPEGVQPVIKTYMSDGIFVGIDLVTGFFHAECENIEKAEQVYDDLFVYRGLDEQDLRNYFLVAEYVRLKNKRL